MPAQTQFYRSHPNTASAARSSRAEARPFDKGFSDAIEARIMGQAQESQESLTAAHGSAYAEGYSYGWLEAELIRTRVSHSRIER